jgi:lipopolysaccharide heptosyltransferase I
MVEERNAPILAGHPAIDEIFTVPRRWYKSWEHIRRVRHTLREWSFDVALDVQSLTKSAFLAWLSGANFRVCFARPQGRELAPWLATHRVSAQGTHVVEIFLSLLRVLGIQSTSAEFKLTQTHEEAAWAESVLVELGLGVRFAVINPGAAWPCKRWPFDRFATVAKFLENTLAMPTLVLWGNQLERSWAETIVARAGGACRLAPRTDLRQMAAILRRASLMISADTGPLHMAAALGVPCVGLFGPTDPARVGPYGPGHIVIRAAKYTGRHPRRAPESLMQAITPEMVCEACAKLLCERKAA